MKGPFGKTLSLFVVALAAVTLVSPLSTAEAARCDGSEYCFASCSYSNCYVVYQDFSACEYITGGCISYNCPGCCCIGLGM